MSRDGYVLDASALLCLLFEEPGADRVERVLHDASVSAVNLAEVVGKLIDRGLDGEEALAYLRELDLDVVALDRGQAEGTGLLRPATRGFHLSLGDRACLVLAKQKGVPALTTDRRQAEAAGPAGVTVELIR